MRAVIGIALFVFSLVSASAQVNLKPLETKGFEIKHKLKPYKKTEGQLLKLKVKNITQKAKQVNFQLFLYVDGQAESMSKHKDVCLSPNKKVKYRFLFEPEKTGKYSVEFEQLQVNEVDSCGESE